MSMTAMAAASMLYACVAYDQIKKGNLGMGLAFCGYAFSNLCFIGAMR